LTKTENITVNKEDIWNSLDVQKEYERLSSLYQDDDDKVSDSEINDLIDMYLDDVFSWAMEEWIADQLMLGKTSDIAERLENNHYLKLIKHNLGRR